MLRASCSIIFFTFITSMSACTTGNAISPDRGLRYSYSPHGSVVISRIAPDPNPFQPQKLSEAILRLSSHSGPWIQINLSERTLSFKDGRKTLLSSELTKSMPVTPGMYEVQLKQESPLWYAPDMYFEARQLPLPAEGDRSRYLKGAYGPYAIFLDADTPIFSGPGSIPEVNGFQIEEHDLQRIFQQVKPGTTVVVR